MTEQLLEHSPKAAPHADGDPARPRSVCFVCTGNTCRSPMAQAVADHLSRAELARFPESIRALTSPRLTAHSAGLAAIDGDPIAPNAVLALEEAGILPLPGRDYHNHTAHTLSAEEAERYDLLVGLTRDHAFSLLLQFPHLAGRILSMPESIPDPYGGDVARYRLSLEQITRGVKTLFFSDAPEQETDHDTE